MIKDELTTYLQPKISKRKQLIFRNKINSSCKSENPVNPDSDNYRFPILPKLNTAPTGNAGDYLIRRKGACNR